VLVCHGLGGSKASQLSMAKRLIPAGYNALAFDFRGTGASGPSLISFGDLERRDVLGAVRWLREHHPDQSQQIVGVGSSTGAAALLAAAADQSDEGRAIQAVAVYGGFADLSTLARVASHGAFLPPADWLVARIGLPIASMQIGTNLSKFRPATYANEFWPRPILVIHGGRDEVVPFEQGQSLFDAATFPRERLWLPMSGHKQTIDDENAAETVREFFDSAQSMPVI